jgi:hypothetical protein
MKYNVTLIDPSSYKFAYMLTDICRTLAAGIRELGHECDLTVNNIELTAVNIIVGTHLLAKPAIESLVNSGARYIVLHTEWLYPGNPPHQIRSTFQGDDFEPVNRQLFERAEAVWDGLDNNLDLLARWDIPREKLKSFWIGYTDALVDVIHRDESCKDIDVLFFGTVTPYRAPILEQLSRSLRLVIVGDAPRDFRNDYIARAKINLCVHSSPELNYYSFTRAGYLLNNRAFVLSETSLKHRGMLDVVEHASRDRLPQRALELLADGDLATLAEREAEHYRLMPMKEIVRPLL